MKSWMTVAFLAIILVSCGDKSETKGKDAPQVEDAKITWRLTFENDPVANTKDNTALLIIDAPGQTVEVIDIDPQMPAHGHGTVKSYQKIERLDDGGARFKISGLFFVMPGDWVIHVIAELDGEETKHSFDVEVR